MEYTNKYKTTITRIEVLAQNSDPENLICCTDFPPLHVVKNPSVLTGRLDSLILPMPH